MLTSPLAGSRTSLTQRSELFSKHRSYQTTMIYSFLTSRTRLYLQYMGASGDSSFVSKLYSKPLVSGDDDNVPPWHTRKAVSVLREWNPDADVTYVLTLVFRPASHSLVLQVR